MLCSYLDMLEITQRKHFLNGMPTESMIALTAGEFCVAGEIMAMSILQGGPAANFLKPVVLSYINREPLCPESNTDQLNKDTATRVSK